MALEYAFTGLRRGTDVQDAHETAYGKCQGKELFQRAISQEKYSLHRLGLSFVELINLEMNTTMVGIYLKDG